MKLAPVLVASLLALSPLAHAGGPASASQSEADKLFVAGQASYQQGKYLDAIQQFKDAYELAHDPVYLFNIAQSYRKVADCVAANDYYVKYLEAEPSATNRDKVDQWISELKPCVDKAREREAEAQRAAAEAERQRKEAEAAQARAKQAEAQAAQPQERTVDRGMPMRYGGIALAGVGVVGLIVGIGYGIHGNSIESDLAAACSPPKTCMWDSPEIQSMHSDGRSANTLSAIGYVGGGLALIGGAALYMLGRSRVEHVTVTPAASGSGATVGATLSF